MATGRIILPPLAWYPTSAQPGLLSFYSGAATTHPVWLLDGSAEKQGIQITFRVPGDFASTPVLHIDWMSDAADQSEIPGLTTAVLCIAEAEDLDDESADAENTSADETTPGDYATHDLVQSLITLTNNDMMGAGELCTILLYVDNVTWTLTTGPCMFLGAIFTYTTT